MSVCLIAVLGLILILAISCEIRMMKFTIFVMKNVDSWRKHHRAGMGQPRLIETTHGNRLYECSGCGYKFELVTGR